MAWGEDINRCFGGEGRISNMPILAFIPLLIIIIILFVYFLKLSLRMISKISNSYNSISIVSASQITFNSDFFQNLISKVLIFVI